MMRMLMVWRKCLVNLSVSHSDPGQHPNTTILFLSTYLMDCWWCMNIICWRFMGSVEHPNNRTNRHANIFRDMNIFQIKLFCWQIFSEKQINCGWSTNGETELQTLNWNWMSLGSIEGKETNNNKINRINCPDKNWSLGE